MFSMLPPINRIENLEETTMFSLIYFLLIGLAAGWLAGKLMKGHGFGILGNLMIGVIGSILGGFLFGLLGLQAVGLLGEPDRSDSAGPSCCCSSCRK